MLRTQHLSKNVGRFVANETSAGMLRHLRRPVRHLAAAMAEYCIAMCETAPRPSRERFIRACPTSDFADCVPVVVSPSPLLTASTVWLLCVWPCRPGVRSTSIMFTPSFLSSFLPSFLPSILLCLFHLFSLTDLHRQVLVHLHGLEIAFAEARISVIFGLLPDSGVRPPSSSHLDPRPPMHPPMGQHTDVGLDIGTAMMDTTNTTTTAQAHATPAPRHVDWRFQDNEKMYATRGAVACGG